MEENMQARLDHYLELLGKIKESVADEATAVRILGEVAKDARMDKIRQEREKQNGDLATSRQLAFLKRLGVDAPDDLTKKRASGLIDDALEKGE